MNIVLAALDTSAVARPVLETALGIGELFGAAVEAVHVADGLAETPGALAARSGVPFRLLDGPVEETLLDALLPASVVAGVIGARATPAGRRPVGRIALRLLERADKPMVVVPPEAVGVSPRPFRRLLVPLEGSEGASRSVLDRLCPLLAVDVEFIVLHVFTERTLPRALDHPARDLAMFGAEFVARHLPDAVGIELRTGPVGQGVADVCAEQHADLVVLSWSQDSSHGGATAVRDVLGHALVPVLLVPLVTSGAAEVLEGPATVSG